MLFAPVVAIWGAAGDPQRGRWAPAITPYDARVWDPPASVRGVLQIRKQIWRERAGRGGCRAHKHLQSETLAGPLTKHNDTKRRM